MSDEATSMIGSLIRCATPRLAACLEAVAGAGAKIAVNGAGWLAHRAPGWCSQRAWSLVRLVIVPRGAR